MHIPQHSVPYQPLDNVCDTTLRQRGSDLVGRGNGSSAAIAYRDTESGARDHRGVLIAVAECDGVFSSDAEHLAEPLQGQVLTCFRMQHLAEIRQ